MAVRWHRQTAPEPATPHSDHFPNHHQLGARNMQDNTGGNPTTDTASRHQRLRARWEQLAKPTPTRPDCGNHQWLLIGRHTSSGATVYYQECANCRQRPKPGLWTPKHQVDPNNVARWEDHRAANPPCQVCGAWGTEIHHWAPREHFGIEADHWPTAWLCPPCHTYWHQTIRHQQRATA